jgi:long-chain acyl-CoA synthetase
MEESPAQPNAINTQDGEGWRSLSNKEFLDAVKHVALGLIALGLKRGDRVGILANPSGEWTIADMAIMVAGGVVVPLFGNISEDNFVYETTEAEIKILFVDGKEQWEMYERHAKQFKHVISINDTSPTVKAISFDEIQAMGKKLDKDKPDAYRTARDALKPEELAAIIYTSGSTGIPKGVELTHANLTCVLDFGDFNWNPATDRYLSVLPLAHVFGHCINLWVLTWGACIYYSNDYKNLGAICRRVQPTAIVVVPRLLEKVYMKMYDQVHSSSGIKHLIGEWAFSLAKKHQRNALSNFFLTIADKLVYHKLREALGGKIRIVISGGAPLNPDLQRFFDTVGIPIYEGWGMTEACPVCVNIPNAKKVGTVGLPLHGQQLKVTPEGEVLVKGTLVMKGYYRHPELTAQTIDQENWLHTGDRGSIDEDGFLTIKGRMKELYKTSTGEYVAPVPIEQALAKYPLIDMSMVVADGRKFASCLLFPNMDILGRMKAQRKAENVSNEEFLKSDYVKGEIDKLLNELNKHLNHWEQIHGYRFILEPLSIQKGELTPSMKIRREVVASKYSKLIDEMYQEDQE